MRYVFGFDYLFAGGGVYTVICQGCSHAGELNSIHSYRALFCINVDGSERVPVNPVILREQHGKRFVSGVCGGLGFVNLVNERQLFSRRPAVEIENLVPFLICVLTRNQASSGNGARVNKRIASMSRHIYHCNW